MSDDKNTETDEAQRLRFVEGARSIWRLIILLGSFLILSLEIYAIITHQIEFIGVVAMVFAFFYLAADAVDQGVRRAMSGVRIQARVGSDTPEE